MTVQNELARVRNRTPEVEPLQSAIARAMELDGTDRDLTQYVALYAAWLVRFFGALVTDNPEEFVAHTIRQAVVPVPRMTIPDTLEELTKENRP